jgi:hypothetical protein
MFRHIVDAQSFYRSNVLFLRHIAERGILTH